jgi:ubiquinone/menaquinone biosynthesis C-methylase UbiE
VAAETEDERGVRRLRRTLFDGVAQLYEASRPGYPSRIVDFVIDTAGIGTGSAVLEVGCGTGQLTESLAGHGFDLTAIDIGPSLIDTARHRLGDSTVSFEVVSFEEFTGPPGSFELIISATAFHWVDPEIRYRKSARLLRPGGWLAVLATGERYDDPFGGTLREMWDVRSPDGGAWRKQPRPSDSEAIAESGLFEPAVHTTEVQRMTMPVESIIGVENTRATSLSWPHEVREEFTGEMRRHLGSHTEVGLIQETSLTMARVRGRAGL